MTIFKAKCSVLKLMKHSALPQRCSIRKKENTLFGVLSQGKFGQNDLSRSVASENHSTKF